MISAGRYVNGVTGCHRHRHTVGGLFTWRDIKHDVIQAVARSAHCALLTLDFIPSDLWPPNSPGLNRVDYSLWSIMQEKV